MQLSFFITPEGKLPEGIKATLARVIPTLAGKKVKLELVEVGKGRSLKQNSYWFGMINKYILPKFRDTGANWSDFSIHEHIMRKLGYEEAMVTPKGEIVASRIHSSDFTTIQWEEFMERARAFVATEYEIYLPLPNETEFA